jgi:GTP cyclohydrolase II
VNQLKNSNIEVVERMPLVVGINKGNRKYLETKIEKMGHEISNQELNTE